MKILLLKGWRVPEKEMAWPGGSLAGRGEILRDLFWDGGFQICPLPKWLGAGSFTFWHNAAKVKVNSDVMNMTLEP